MSLIKSLRFKLTITYSLILFIFAGFLVLGLNLFLDDYLQRDPSKFPKFSQQIDIITQEDVSFPELPTEEKYRIRQIRLNDLQTFREISLISLIPLALLSFGVGYIISGSFLHPLKELKREIDAAKSDSLGNQIIIKTDDEIGELIKSYNEMSLRLQKSFESQKLFVQDASHELRTPLTIMKTNVDVALEDPKATNEKLRSSMVKVLAAIDNMTMLSDNLLALTVPHNDYSEEVELNKILKEQVNLLSGYSKVNGVNLIAHLEENKTYKKSNSLNLSRAFFNIIENAIKYSKDVIKPEVMVSTKNIKDMFIVTIEDNGKGVPKSEQQNIFERFYRVDKSRSKNTGGFGLGLPISKKIIEENNGTIELTSKPGKTIFTIKLKLT
jgi:signal transduction histidine kinase